MKSCSSFLTKLIANVIRGSYKTRLTPQHPEWVSTERESYPRCLPGPIWPELLCSVCIIWLLCGSSQLWAFPVNEPLTARSRLISVCLYLSGKGQASAQWLRLLRWCQSFDTSLMRGRTLQPACSDRVQGSMDQRIVEMVFKVNLFHKRDFWSLMIS